jgi:hypothetical protein
MNDPKQSAESRRLLPSQGGGRGGPLFAAIAQAARIWGELTVKTVGLWLLIFGLFSAAVIFIAR